MTEKEINDCLVAGSAEDGKIKALNDEDLAAVAGGGIGKTLKKIGKGALYVIKLTCYDNARIESLNGVLKTECLYARFGKTKVKDRRIPVRELASRVEEFIPYYNEKRKKDSLNASPVQFRMNNSRGTYLEVIQEKV